MSAKEELIAFGYIEEPDGSLVKYKAGKPREKWAPAEGGYERFTREDGEWVGVPYKIRPDWEGVAGLDFATKPQCFLTVYPEVELEYIYSVGNQEQAARMAEYEARKGIA